MKYSIKLMTFSFKTVLLCVFIMYFSPNIFGQYQMKGEVIDDTINSKVLVPNKVGLNTKRNVKIYLPPSYATSKKNYPVVYYLHNLFSNPSIVINDHKTPEIIDKSISENRSNEFIFVVPDFTSPTIGCLFENSGTSGYWLDFISKELVVHMDNNYRTITDKDSRAVIGHFMGGRGALNVGMKYPTIFSIVYALHPVATGSGYLPRVSLNIDWGKVHAAKSYKDINENVMAQIFTSVCQAFLPNPNRPPLYCDFLFEKDENGALQLNPKNVRKEQKEFHLDEKIDEYADHLRSLKAIAFDWARFDQTQAHVISNRRFSKKLMDVGVDHEGIEFVGDPWNKYWGDNGRIATRVLPFLNKHLKFY